MYLLAWADNDVVFAQIRFLADTHAAFTNAVDLAFDATAIFGQPRSRRYALVIEDGKVQEMFVEPDNTGLTGQCRQYAKKSDDGTNPTAVSRAENVIGSERK